VSIFETLDRNRFSYLALVEDVDGLPAPTEDFGIILVDGPLGIANSSDILDHNDVIRVLAFGLFLALGGHFRRLVEQPIGVDHVIDDAALADLLGPKLLMGGEIVPIVVAEMVVRGDGERLDACVHQELGQDRLELGLTGLEIITSNEGFLALSKGDNSRNESVLWSTVDERLAFQNGSDGEKSRGGDF